MSNFTSFVFSINSIKNIGNIRNIAYKVQEDIRGMWETTFLAHDNFDPTILVDSKVKVMSLESFHKIWKEAVKIANETKSYIENHIKYVKDSSFILLEKVPEYEIWVALVVTYISWVTNISNKEVLNSIYSYCNYSWKDGFSF